MDIKTYEIEIEGPGIKEITLKLEDLKKLPKHTVAAVVMCAGNRRSEMSEVCASYWQWNTVVAVVTLLLHLWSTCEKCIYIVKLLIYDLKSFILVTSIF